MFRGGVGAGPLMSHLSLKQSALLVTYRAVVSDKQRATHHKRLIVPAPGRCDMPSGLLVLLVESN